MISALQLFSSVVVAVELKQYYSFAPHLKLHEEHDRRQVQERTSVKVTAVPTTFTHD